ncbi:NADPH oxidase organizer 1-like [Polypterus senegalus]|uniref:NADPH oxidase organizer 1-like n=1 Tax=Polypterus senegalus TaxID=55291 RepID=UPI0019623EDF|nr:NADPH oxidase organizer 1-like [Polypterus senegalus]
MNAHRYPVGVRLIGVMKHDRHKVFLTSVLWSDQNDILVYRSFVEFKKLHKQLKTKLTAEGAEEHLPKFQDVPVKTLLRKNSEKSLLRLKFLDKYWSALQVEVFKRDEVIQFLLPRNEDLEPTLPKNSSIIIPSEEDQDSEVDSGVAPNMKRHSAGNITNPFIAQTYECVATYDTKDTKNQPFKVAVGEKVEVLVKNPEGWWLVENEARRLAWFPAPYLEKCDDTVGEETLLEDMQEEGQRFYAVRGYKASNADELSLQIGVVVEVLQKADDGWWLIRYNGHNGYVPSMYLQPYRNPHAKLQTILHKDLGASTTQLFRSDRWSQHTGTSMKGSSRHLEDPKQRPLNRQVSRSLNFLPLPTAVLQDREGDLRSVTDTRKHSLSSESEKSYSSKCSDSEEPAMTPKGSDLGSSELVGHNGGDLAVPKVPPRPKTKEILSRCSTITKRAMLAPKLPNTDVIQGR